VRTLSTTIWYTRSRIDTLRHRARELRERLGELAAMLRGLE
jgi:hypothetical protein